MQQLSLHLAENLAELDARFGASADYYAKEIMIYHCRGCIVLFDGMATAGGGAVLSGLLLGAIAAFVIDRRFNWAAVYALAAAVFSFFGFIHSETLAINASPSVSVGYGLAAITFLALAIKTSKEEGKWDWSPIDNGNEPMH